MKKINPKDVIHLYITNDMTAQEVADKLKISKGSVFRILSQEGVNKVSKARRDKQQAGIAKAKAEGKLKGRQSVINAKEIKRLNEQGLNAGQISKQLGCGIASVYRILRQLKQ